MDVRINPAGTRFTLLSSEPYPEYGITVPAGYVTDFASVPRFLWSIYPPLGWYAHAALLHDYMYDLHHAGSNLVSRTEADRRLRDTMKRDGVGWRTRWTFWALVRVFGWKYWSEAPSR